MSVCSSGATPSALFADTVRKLPLPPPTAVCARPHRYAHRATAGFRQYGHCDKCCGCFEAAMSSMHTTGLLVCFLTLAGQTAQISGDRSCPLCRLVLGPRLVRHSCGVDHKLLPKQYLQLVCEQCILVSACPCTVMLHRYLLCATKLLCEVLKAPYQRRNMAPQFQPMFAALHRLFHLCLPKSWGKARYQACLRLFPLSHHSIFMDNICTATCVGAGSLDLSDMRAHRLWQRHS